MKKDTLRIFLLCVFLFSLGTAGQEITRINIRFALMVQDMVCHGMKLFPTLNGVEYGDYPSLWIMLARLFSLNGKFLNLWTLSLPSILAGSAAAALVFRTGEQQKAGQGFAAVSLLLITPQFAELFSGFGIDVPVMAAAAVMLYLYRSRLNGRWLCLAFCLLFAFCFAVRGPMGAVVFAAGCGGGLVMSGKWKLLAGFILSGFIAALLCGGIWSAAVWNAGGRELWDWFIYCQLGSRMGTPEPLSNLLNAFFSLSPLTLVCTALPFLCPHRKWSPFMRFCLGFLLAPPLLLSFCTSFHLRYLALILPAMALLAAEFAGQLREQGKYREKFLLAEKWCLKLETPFLLSGIAVLAAVCGFMFSGFPAVHFCAAFLLILTGSRLFRGSWTRFRFAWGIAVFLILGIAPFQNTLENSENFVRQIAKCNPERIFLYETGPDHDDLKLLWNLAPAERKKIQYVFWEIPELKGFYRKMYPARTLKEILPELRTGDMLVLRNRTDEKDSIRAEIAGHGLLLRQSVKGRLGHREYLAAEILTGQ